VAHASCVLPWASLRKGLPRWSAKRDLIPAYPATFPVADLFGSAEGAKKPGTSFPRCRAMD